MTWSYTNPSFVPTQNSKPYEMLLAMRRKFGIVADLVLGDRYKLDLAYTYCILKTALLFLKPNKFGSFAYIPRLKIRGLYASRLVKVMSEEKTLVLPADSATATFESGSIFFIGTATVYCY
jgi:hypothetical protein